MLDGARERVALNILDQGQAQFTINGEADQGIRISLDREEHIVGIQVHVHRLNSVPVEHRGNAPIAAQAASRTLAKFIAGFGSKLRSINSHDSPSSINGHPSGGLTSIFRYKHPPRKARITGWWPRKAGHPKERLPRR